MTEYVILAKTEEGSWAQGRTVEARSAKAAIRGFLNGEPVSATFIAVPARSWKPITVKVETKTELRFS